MGILFLLILVGTVSNSANTPSNIPPELINSYTKNQSRQELTTRISELESLLRKKNRLIELQNEQITILKAAVSAKSE